MALKRSSKLFWRLFAPLVALLWGIIGLLVWYNISNELDLRQSLMETQLKNVNATVIDAYEHGEDLQETLDFIDSYTRNTTLNDLRVSVYNDLSQPVACIGSLILLEDSSHQTIPELLTAEEIGGATNIRPDLKRSVESMFNVMTSNDGVIRTITAAPYTPMVARSLSYNTSIWLIVAALAVIATFMLLGISRNISQSVSTLHTFAQRAADGKTIDIANVKFSHDEIGDVTREVMRLYIEKDKATQRMEHEHQVALRANEEKARIKRQTANNLNHEIKTPVGIIKGYLDTICSDPDMPPSLKDNFINKAREHTDRLTQLLKDVSSITRLEEGASQVEVTEFDFHDLVYNISNDLEVSDLLNNMSFVWDIPFDTRIIGNYTLLNNAIMNLVRNSAKYSKGTVISLKLIETTDSTCTFLFADDGTGVGEQHLDHLFDRFYRVDEGRARKSGGTGLGLPIVKSTFEAIGGSIIVRNANPHGLEFLFTLKKAQNERS
ncbi:MAG: HAMP domain-containing histidine kinase [Muribaculaceae bacterium]|nr:HAMP domain-containing histidine kinase [Muribaculaceae bacterium]